MIKIDFKQRKREVLWKVVALFFIAIGVSVFKFSSATSGFEITDELGGNIFPSAILSVATTDAQVIQPADSIYLGNPKSCIAIKVKSRSAYSRVRIDVAEENLNTDTPIAIKNKATTVQSTSRLRCLKSILIILIFQFIDITKIQHFC